MKPHRRLTIYPFHPFHCGTRAHLDAEVGEDVLKGCRRQRLLAWEEPIRSLHDRHDRSQAGEGLRHLDADRSTSEHRERLWQRCQLEKGLVGSVLDRLDAWDWWDERIRTRGDHDGMGQHCGPVHLDGVGTGKPGRSFTHVNPLL